MKLLISKTILMLKPTFKHKIILSIHYKDFTKRPTKTLVQFLFLIFHVRSLLNMKKLFLILLIIISPIISKAEDARTWRASIGAGIAVKKNNRVNNLYKRMGKKAIILPIPFVTGSIGRLSLGPQGLTFRALGNHLMSVSIYAKFDGDKYLGLGMNPRRQSTFIGLSTKFFKYGLNLQKDVSRNSHGYTAQLSYGEFYKLTDTLMLRAGLSLEWADDRYAEYYYGVRSHEATADRREYHLKNYFQPGINVLPILKLTDDLSMTTALGFKLIPKDVRNSPTMNGKKLEIGGLMGISYSL